MISDQKKSKYPSEICLKYTYISIHLVYFIQQTRNLFASHTSGPNCHMEHKNIANIIDAKITIKNNNNCTHIILFVMPFIRFDNVIARCKSFLQSKLFGQRNNTDDTIIIKTDVCIAYCPYCKERNV